MVILKLPGEIEKIRTSNIIVAEILNELKEKIKPGLATIELDVYAEELARRKGVSPAFRGYRGYPFSLCTSVNFEVVHGMPSDRILLNGDIISLDFGVYCGGYYGDAAITVPVGNVSEEAARLMEVTEQGLYEGIKEARAGNRLGDISSAVQMCVEAAGFSVVRDFVGHGIGKNLHEEPQIPNYGVRGRGVELKTGMVLAIEPMVNEGTSKVRILPDGWTVVTEDVRLSAHFEHSVAITDKESGVKVIKSTGYVPNKSNPKVKRTVSVQASTGIGVSFKYGMLVGDGGISMGNGSHINGSVYSNGSITGGNNETITGDVYVAGGTQATADEESN
ncbi:MAG: type I methionyl aminopeptidase, partial [Syntrophales bacterium]|nr:type I methionyl aminopeptidase [Syntrophales bacterium]